MRELNNKNNTQLNEFTEIGDYDSLKSVTLSIIIPVYNGEKFIKRCIDKVLKVELNKEIIVVNDCSKDRSLEILKEYGDKIKLIDLKQNGGVSHARNKGLGAATGDYVAFIDVDDDFEIDMHKKLLSKILSENADVCMCNNDVIETDGKVIRSKYAVDFGELEQKDVIKKYLLDKIFPAIWASVYKSSLAKSISYSEEIRIGEDILYALRILLRANKTCFVNETLYHYIQYPSSAMHSISNKMCEYLKVPNLLTENEKLELEKNYAEEFSYFKLEMVQRCVHAISLVARNNKKEAKQLLKTCYNKQICKAIVKNNYSPRYVKIEFFVLKTFGVSFHLFMFPFYVFLRKVLRG